MSILSTINKALPFRVVRNPQRKQGTNPFGPWAWLNPYLNAGMGDRSKTAKPTWTTYYQAMDNVWVGSCIDAYVLDAMAAGFDVYSDNREEDNPDFVSYVKDLLNHPDGPDGRDSYIKFMTRGIGSLLGTGDWFAECVNDDNLQGLPTGLYFIQPHRLQYHYDTDQWGLNGTQIRYENDELIHVELADPWNELYGKSPIDKIANDITLDILGMRNNSRRFEKGISPKNVISFDAAIADTVFKDNIKKIKASAKDNPDGTYFLRGGTFQDLGQSNKDMQFSEMLDKMRDRIVAGYGVPPQNVGIYTAGSLGNEKDMTADKKFKKRLDGKVLKPVENEFNRVFGKSFDLWGFDERFHFGVIDLEDKQQKATINNIRLRNGSLLVNEDRTAWGLDPVEYGDQPLSYAIGGSGYGGLMQQPSFEPSKSINKRVMSLDNLLQSKGLVKMF